MAIYVGLNRHVERVQIIQHQTGIGLTTHARCYTGEQYVDVDITDTEAW